tara:strand:+ start:1063 stop:2604 length:1542 start_codon:yes stop_codon:yes gene_type:complete
MQRVVRISVSLRKPDYTFPWQSQSRSPNKGVGTGFFYNGPNKETWVVTCAHVVEAAYDIKFLHNKKEISARLLFVCPELDIAVIEPIESDETSQFPKLDNNIINLEELKANDSVIAVGFPLANEQIITSNGIISGSNGYLIQTTAAINSGNSGGPLLQKHTKAIIGINSSKAAGMLFSSIDNIGYSVPISLLEKCISIYSDHKSKGNESEEHKPFKIPFSSSSGITFSRSTPKIRKCYSDCDEDGCLISEIEHPQLKDILKPKDVLLSVGNDKNTFNLYGKQLSTDKKWIEQDIDLKTYLILFGFNEKINFKYWNAEEGEKTHSVDCFNSYDPTIKELFYYDDIDSIDYLVLGGMVLIELTENLQERYYEDVMWKVLTQEKGKQRNRVVISTIFPSSLPDEMKVVEAFDAIHKINNKDVYTLEDVKKIVTSTTHSSNCLEIEMFPYAKLILPVERLKEDDQTFLELFNYPINKTLSNLPLSNTNTESNPNLEIDSDDTSAETDESTTVRIRIG